MLTLHAVWSIGSSVALAEALAGALWRDPWLRLPGRVVTAMFTMLGCVAVLVLVAIVAAFAGFRGTPERSGTGGAGARDQGDAGARDQGDAANRRAPSFWLVLASALVLSSAFQRLFVYAPSHAVRPVLALAGLLGLEATAVVLFAIWAGRAGWGPTHALAASLGAILTYGWISLRRLVVAGGTSLGVPTTPVDIVGQVALLLVVVGLCGLAWRKLRRPLRIQE